MSTEESHRPFIPKKDIRIVFTPADLNRLTPSCSVCLFPLFFTGKELLSAMEFFKIKEIRSTVIVNVQPERQDEIEKILQPFRSALRFASTPEELIDPDDPDSLFDELKESLNNLSGSSHFNLVNTCSLVMAVTGIDLIILGQDKRLLTDTRVNRPLSIPFQDWSVHLDNELSFSGTGTEEILFHHDTSRWYGYVMMSYGHVSGYVFFQALPTNMAPDILQRKLLRPYLLMARIGDSRLPVQEKKKKSEFLMSIIYGLISHRDGVKKECDIYHIPFEGLRYIWILKLRNFNRSVHNPDVIIHLCEKAFPDNYFLFDQEQVISIHEKGDESDATAANRVFALMDRIERNYPQLECVVGNSRAYQDLFDLRMAYQDALFSLRVGQSLFPHSKKFLTFNDLLLYHFLIGQKDNPILQRLYNNTILTLRKNDAEYNENLLKTMDILARKEFHISEASEELGIHRNTLYQRMEKIKSLTSLDLKSQEGILVMQLGLKLDLIYSVES